MAWPCFWVEDTGEAEWSLRRYHSEHRKDEPGFKCCPTSPWGYCNETASVGRDFQRRAANGYLDSVSPAEYDGDPRWPVECSYCGRSFGPLTELDNVSDGTGRVIDHTQVNQEPIYRAADGREWTQRGLPPGAMFDAVWYHDTYVGADGISLMVVLPPERAEGKHLDYRGQHWCPDRPSSPPEGSRTFGPAWTRTGDPRNPPSLSITPSILTPEYHGFLTAGVLTDSL